MLQEHTPLQPSLFSLLLLENLNPSSLTPSSTSKFSPWWFVKLPRKPSGASAACREQTRVEAGGVEKVQRELPWWRTQGHTVLMEVARGGGEQLNPQQWTQGILDLVIPTGLVSSTLHSLLLGACKVPNPKVTPHSGFHVRNGVISKESKKEIMKFSPGSTPEQQVWVRGFKSTSSLSSPQFPQDFTAQI